MKVRNSENLDKYIKSPNEFEESYELRYYMELARKIGDKTREEDAQD